MFSLQNRADKPLRINWPLNYTLQYVLQAVTLTGRCSVFLSFVCFSGFRFKYRRQVRSVLGLERRQTCALDPRLNSQSNCTQGILLVPIKKELSVMCLNKRGGGTKRGGGAHQRVFYIRVSLFKDPNKGEKAVHGCHYPNLTTAFLAQLLSALFVSTDKSLCNLRGEDCDASAGICLSGPDL